MCAWHLQYSAFNFLIYLSCRGYPTQFIILYTKSRFYPLRNSAAIVKLIENYLNTKHDAAKKTHFSEYFCDGWLCAHVAGFHCLAANFSMGNWGLRGGVTLPYLTGIGSSESGFGVWVEFPRLACRVTTWRLTKERSLGQTPSRTTS